MMQASKTPHSDIHITPNLGEKVAQPRGFHVMTKPRGAICNLDCQYCYYLHAEDLYPNSDFWMSDETLETFTRQYIEAQRVPEVTFAWQGGEPTLIGLDFFEKAVAYQNKFRKPGMRILNTLQTNGTLLDDDWCRFFRVHKFLVGISLDGPRHLHDEYRVDKGGKSSYERVMTGLELLKRYRVEHNILTCVHAANANYPLEVYRFFRDQLNAQFVQFIPIVERDNETGFQEGNEVTSRSVTGSQYGDFLIAIFDEWVRRDVGRVFVQIFDISLGVWHLGKSSLCVFDETCGLALALEHNGDLYSCDHYVEPRHRLGNINDVEMISLIATQKQEQFGFAKNQFIPRYCRECGVHFICKGGCPKNRFIKTPDGEAGLNYLCEGYKAFFNHIDESMRVMSGLLKMGKTPAKVMDILVEKEKAAHFSNRKGKSRRSKRGWRSKR